MIESRCGIKCSDCEYLLNKTCLGCTKISKPFWGDKCTIKSSCEEKGHSHCGVCSSFPCAELNAFSYDLKQGDNGKRIQQCKEWKEKADKGEI